MKTSWDPWANIVLGPRGQMGFVGLVHVWLHYTVSHAHVQENNHIYIYIELCHAAVRFRGVGSCKMHVRYILLYSMKNTHRCDERFFNHFQYSNSDRLIGHEAIAPPPPNLNDAARKDHRKNKTRIMRQR